MPAIRPPSPTAYVPSDIVDSVVLTVLTVVCLIGATLIAPAADHTAPNSVRSGDGPLILTDGGIDPANAPTGIIPDPIAPEAPTPSVPAIKPPPDIDLPSIKPDPPSEPLIAIKVRAAPDIAPSQLIATGPAFISLMGTNYDPTNWHRSTHSATSDFLATDWSTDHAVYGADGLALKLERAPGNPNQFLGGEIQTNTTYGYGRYEVLMRPAKASGTVSSFFTYTGPYYGNPHDEVDIEFLGQDTRKIYLNYFRNGRVGSHVTLDLPFDAADQLHLYAFEWRPDSITWFIDGVPVHQTAAGDTKILRTPGSIIVNLWSGKPKLQSWHGAPDFTGPVEAEYACISFQPLGSTSRSCSTIFPPEAARKEKTRTNVFGRAVSNLLKSLSPPTENQTQSN